ncbi:VASt domain, partial [Trinorchestia longiramus]
QTLAPETRTGEVYVVNSEVKNEGIPLADSFLILVHVCIARSSPPENCENLYDDVTEWCTYSCYAIITYKKNVWGVIKGQLERSVYSGMEGIHRDVAAALRDRAEGSLPHSADVRSNRALALNARKKRKARMAGYDKSESQGKYEYMYKSSGWLQFFFNLVLLLSTLLLVTLNVNLLSKVHSLEAVSRNLTMDKACPPVIVATLESDQFDIPVNSSEPGDAWSLVKSFLASQKAAYSTELLQMGNHLQRAANALNQADSELHFVMDRIPNSLDTLEGVVKDHVRNEQLVQQINELLRRSEQDQ